MKNFTETKLWTFKIQVAILLVFNSIILLLIALFLHQLLNYNFIGCIKKIFFYKNAFICFRLYPFLCEAVKQLVIDSCTDEAAHNRLRRKEYYLGIINLKTKHRVRHLTADKIGKLLRISGQVVRTHPVHPELCFGSFICDDCGVSASHIPQQFKYTAVIIFFILFNKQKIIIKASQMRKCSMSKSFTFFT